MPTTRSGGLVLNPIAARRQSQGKEKKGARRRSEAPVPKTVPKAKKKTSSRTSRSKTSKSTKSKKSNKSKKSKKKKTRDSRSEILSEALRFMEKWIPVKVSARLNKSKEEAIAKQQSDYIGLQEDFEQELLGLLMNRFKEDYLSEIEKIEDAAIVARNYQRKLTEEKGDAKTIETLKSFQTKMEEQRRILLPESYAGFRGRVKDKWFMLYRNWIDYLSTPELKPEAVTRQAHALYRSSCLNDLDPIMQTEVKRVEVVPPDNFIKLNQRCYALDSLVDYVKQLPPVSINTSPLDSSLPLWTTDQEYFDLVNSRQARLARLNQYIKSANRVLLAQNFGPETLRMIERTANIMQSQGQDFIEAAQEIFTPEEMARWLQVQEGPAEDFELPSALLNPDPDEKTAEADRILVSKINNQIKAEGLVKLIVFVEALPQATKDLLERASPGLLEALNECHDGNYCVMVLGNKLRTLSEALRAPESQP